MVISRPFPYYPNALPAVNKPAAAGGRAAVQPAIGHGDADGGGRGKIAPIANHRDPMAHGHEPVDGGLWNAAFHVQLAGKELMEIEGCVQMRAIEARRFD